MTDVDGMVQRTHGPGICPYYSTTSEQHFQATIGSIKIPEVHAAIISKELSVIESNKASPGSSKSSMNILGIDEWTDIWYYAALEGRESAISKLNLFLERMNTVVENDKLDLE